jgi:hypothetical protein
LEDTLVKPRRDFSSFGLRGKCRADVERRDTRLPLPLPGPPAGVALPGPPASTPRYAGRWGGKAEARATVRLTELFARLVQSRNQAIGHGAHGRLAGDFHERMAGALLAGTAELLGRLDVLAGRRLAGPTLRAGRGEPAPHRLAGAAPQ